MEDELVATSYLEASGWQIEEAVSLFFDGGNSRTNAAMAASAAMATSPVAATSSSSSSSAAATSSVSGAQQSSTSSGTGGSQMMEAQVRSIMESQGVDELTARAIAEAQGPSAPADAEDDVRAPIARTTGRLFDQSHNPGFLFGMDPNLTYGTPGQVAFRNFEQEAREMEARARDGLGNTSVPVQSMPRGPIQQSNMYGDADDDDKDESNYMDYENEDNTSRNANLQTIFEPPRELMFPGDFEAARTAAHSQKKWLLVNIQKDGEFFSYVLNRDLWRADVIKSLVRESFIFFQREFNDSVAQNYIRLYKPETFPHVGIIDPRTGELVSTLKLHTRAAEKDPNDLQFMFIEKADSFLSSHQMEPTARVTPPPAPGSSSTPPASQSMLSPAVSRPEPAAAPSTPTPPPALAIAYEPLEDEPDKSQSGVTQVRIRLFDGRMIVRSFLTSQKISQLFSLVHSLVPETSTQPFDISGGFPPKSLLDKKERTFADENLLRANLKVKWVD